MEQNIRRITMPGLSSRALKNIAVCAMLFDHFIAVFWMGSDLAGVLLRIPGRIVAPIMCYMIAEGFIHTSNIKKYLARLFVFALISHFPYVLYFELNWWHAISVIWSLFLGLLSLTIAKNARLPQIVKVLGIFFCCLLAVPADWNYVAVLWILCFGLFHGQRVKQFISFAVIEIVVHFLPNYLESGSTAFVQLGVFLAIPLLCCYNGKRGAGGRAAKWGFYIFYPAHLLVLWILKLALGV